MAFIEDDEGELGSIEEPPLQGLSEDLWGRHKDIDTSQLTRPVRIRSDRLAGVSLHHRIATTSDVGFLLVHEELGGSDESDELLVLSPLPLLAQVVADEEHRDERLPRPGGQEGQGVSPATDQVR